MENTFENRTHVANVLLDNPKYRTTIQNLINAYLDEHKTYFEDTVEYLTEQNEL